MATTRQYAFPIFAAVVQPQPPLPPPQPQPQSANHQRQSALIQPLAACEPAAAQPPPPHAPRRLPTVPPGDSAAFNPAAVAAVAAAMSNVAGSPSAARTLAYVQPVDASTSHTPSPTQRFSRAENVVHPLSHHPSAHRAAVASSTAAVSLPPRGAIASNLGHNHEYQLSWGIEPSLLVRSSTSYTLEASKLCKAQWALK